MSETAKGGEFLDSYEAVHLDPFISNVFENIADTNEEIASTPLNSGEINKIMRRLDLEWRPLMGKTAFYTGVGFFPPQDEPWNRNPDADFYESETVEFKGVVPRELAVVEYGDSEEETKRLYELRVSLRREALNSKAELVYIIGSVRPEDVVTLEFPEFVSPERAKNWMKYYHAEFAHELEERLRAPSIEECEAVMRLDGMVCDVATVHASDDDQMRVSARSVDAWTNQLIGFDKEAPYYMEISGHVREKTRRNKEEVVELDMGAMVNIEQVVWRPLPVLDGDRDVSTLRYPHLKVRALGKHKNEAATDLFVPLLSVTDLWSYRYSQYHGYDNEDPENSH